MIRRRWKVERYEGLYGWRKMAIGRLRSQADAEAAISRKAFPERYRIMPPGRQKAPIPGSRLSKCHRQDSNL
jgi:hypothetical protein